MTKAVTSIIATATGVAIPEFLLPDAGSMRHPGCLNGRLAILALLNTGMISALETFSALTLALSPRERGQEFWLPSPLGRRVGDEGDSY